MNQTRGFTLVETMIAVVVAGIILAIGVPSFLGFQRTLTKTQARDRVIQDIRYARQLAVTRHRPVVITFGTPPTTTNISTYTLLIDTNNNGVADAGEQALGRRLPRGAVLADVALSPTNKLYFDPSGALAPGTSGGRLVSSNGRGIADTLYISGVGMVYQR
jgi:type IV fimbrial biogenesis protein FimT